MTILVTGGCGYIGSHIVHALHDAGEKIVIIDDLSTGFRMLPPLHIPIVVQSIGKKKVLQDVFERFNPDIVIHCAGSLIVEESVKNPSMYWNNNVVNTSALIDIMLYNSVKNIVFASSAAVYGTPTGVIHENIPCDPVSPYGRTKLTAEQMIRDATLAYGINHVILRFFNVAGADPQMRTGESHANTTHLVKVAAQAVLGLRDNMDIYGCDYPTKDGTCVRDYIHPSDLAQINLLACQYLRNNEVPTTLNVGYGHGYSNLEVVAAMKSAANHTTNLYKYNSRRAGDPPSLVADTRKLFRTLQYIPKHDNIDEICRTALEWERKLNFTYGKNGWPAIG